MRKNFLLLFIIITTICFSQKTYIPDDNFEQKLITLGYDNVLDDSIVTANIINVVDLWVAGSSISDLTGIQDFTSLERLFCYNNNLSELDLSNNLSLILLFAHGNPLTCIEVWDTTPFQNGTINIGPTPGNFYINNNSPITVTSCESYYWLLTDSVYHHSGIYTIDFSNSVGCDSTITLDLTIVNPTSGYTNITSCDSYTWEGQTITQSDTLIHTYPGGNSQGCDSTHTLIVTINNSSDSSTSVTACDSYWWELTDSTYISSGIYSFISTKINGCDSIIHLDLTIQSVKSSITQFGDSLLAVIDIGSQTALQRTKWYNIQTINDTVRIWLMQDSSETFSPRFDCSYFIVVEDDLGCKDTSLTYYYSSLASRIGDMTAYPNPTEDLVTLEFVNDKNQFVIIDLIDNNGIVLEKFKTTYNKLDINLNRYPPGVYYIYFDSTKNTEGCLNEPKEKKLTKIILN